MAYVSTLILRSLRLIGEKQRGDTLSSNEQVECLASLNAMLESWSLERAMLYQVLQESFTLSDSVGSYTIGSGGTFDTDRPLKIVDPCFVRDSSSLDSQLQIIDSVAYGRFVQKTIDGSYPGYLFYDTAYVGGLGTIRLYPEPQAGLTLYINSWKQLASVSTISAQVSLPPGYERAIVYNYAIEESPGYASVPPEVVKIARESKAAVKSLNLPDSMMRLDAGIVGIQTSNILTGP
jgi:hypothetical protein